MLKEIQMNKTAVEHDNLKITLSKLCTRTRGVLMPHVRFKIKLTAEFTRHGQL